MCQGQACHKPASLPVQGLWLQQYQECGLNCTFQLNFKCYTLHPKTLQFQAAEMSTICAAQEPVDVAPISWWQHAGINVLREARQVTGREGCKKRHVCPRQQLRQRYQMIYLEHRSSTFWQRWAFVRLGRLSVNFCSAYLCFSTKQLTQTSGMLIDTDALPHKAACTSQVHALPVAQQF